MTKINMKIDDETMTQWTYEGYWAVVLGDCRRAADVVREFGLADAAAIDAWLDAAESEAWKEVGLGGDIPDEWLGFRQVALAELELARGEVDSDDEVES